MGKSFLITFDIDSTLLKTFPNSPHCRSIQCAMKEMLGLEDKPSDYLNATFSGVSDEWIVNSILKKALSVQTVDPEKRSEFIQKCEENFSKILKEEEVIVLPGVTKLLETIFEAKMKGSCAPEGAHIYTAVCSGNLERIGWKKIDVAKLDKYFPDRIGGFANFEDRADILRDAIKKAENLHGKKFDKVVHIGDAPQDVRAAHDVGVDAIAVKTGYYIDEDFERPCLIVENVEIGFDQIVDFIFS